MFMPFNLLSRFKRARITLFATYLMLISGAGLLLIGWSVSQLPTITSASTFLLLLLFAAFAAIMTTSMPMVGNAGVTYHIGSAISIAAVPLFGLSGAVLTATTQAIVGWLIKPVDPQTWKKTRRQLAFNLGMDALSIFVAGAMLQVAREQLVPAGIGREILPWLLAAVVFEEVNLWLLIIVLRLQHGPSVSVLQLWRNDRWATPIDILLMAVGGGLLAFALQQYDWFGVFIAFLPIALSAAAFRLYAGQMQSYTNNLEQMVSERTRDLTARTAELIELNDQKDVFISVLSHDMMTPLANIRFSAEMIQDDPTVSAENRHLAQLMLYSQSTLHNIVRNILDLARLQELGTVPMQPTVFDLTQLLTQVVQVIQGEAMEKEIVVAYDPPLTPHWLKADRQQIERVFLNLLSNAVKYTPDGGHIQVHITATVDQIQVAIQDNGYGIPADELPQLFERFQRVKQLAEKASGTGLGLAITKALVEQHRGQITVQTAFGVGSTFTVTLPLTKDQSVQRNDY